MVRRIKQIVGISTLLLLLLLSSPIWITFGLLSLSYYILTEGIWKFLDRIITILIRWACGT